ncbi:substrate-binding domain-containing protein [Candidatus Spongiihabitans sp.]|uniref:substrate-binding domain-containing protein n=1 Tax=Candidatus Spongiihabitans sp. TaxID=3101308 RepID=UPI003C7003A4
MSHNWLAKKRHHLVWVIVLLSQHLLPHSAFADERNKIVLLATTTSTENSGLLDYILPYVEADTGYIIRTISAGTGKALTMGQAGDVDVMLVHAKQSELAFVQAGHGINRRRVMFNDFVVVGPADDSASIRYSSNLDEAFDRMASNSALFVSRGDDSGTHKKELEIWRSIGKQPNKNEYENEYGNWYREVGQGMSKTLQIANELEAYTLTDRGTWIFLEERLSMTIVFEDGQRLRNQYSVITINPERHNINYQGAMAFSDWITSKKGQQLIHSYRINGQPLFYANAN